MKKSKNNDSEKDYQIYIDERKSLIAAEESQASSFDKYVLTIASGVFGLTITFINQIVKTINPNTKILLCFSWGFLTASILSILFSFFTSQFAYRKQIEILEEIYLENKNEKDCQINYLSKITFSLNIISILSLVIGLILLFIFVIQNL